MSTVTHRPEMFDGLDEQDANLVTTCLVGTRRVAPGEVICTETRDSREVWVVIEGTANVTRHGISIRTAGPGHTIGELSVLDGLSHRETVTARTDMTLQVFSHERFLELLEESPTLSLSIARGLARRLRSIEVNSGPQCEIW